MTEDAKPKAAKTTPWTRAGIYVVLVLAVFLLGFVPMWLRSRELSRGLSAAEQQLHLGSMRNALASAAIDARRGDYEPARQSASSFFTSLRAATDNKADSVLSPAQTEGVQPLFAQRDEIITLLARSDPAAADRLSNLYVSYRKTMSSQEDEQVLDTASSKR